MPVFFLSNMNQCNFTATSCLLSTHLTRHNRGSRFRRFVNEVFAVPARYAELPVTAVSGRVRSTETSVTNYQSTLRNIPRTAKTSNPKHAILLTSRCILYSCWFSITPYVHRQSPWKPIRCANHQIIQYNTTQVLLDRRNVIYFVQQL